MEYHNAKYLAYCSDTLGREMTIEEIARSLDCLAHESCRELRQIESLMFGGFLEDTKEDGLAWRVFNSVMKLKKDSDDLSRAFDELNAKGEAQPPAKNI